MCAFWGAIEVRSQNFLDRQYVKLIPIFIWVESISQWPQYGEKSSLYGSHIDLWISFHWKWDVKHRSFWLHLMMFSMFFRLRRCWACSAFNFYVSKSRKKSKMWTHWGLQILKIPMAAFHKLVGFRCLPL